MEKILLNLSIILFAVYFYKKIIDKRLILFFNSSNFLNFNFRQHNFPLLLLQKSVWNGGSDKEGLYRFLFL